MPWTDPTTLTLVASNILSANSHWNRLVENVGSSFVTAVGCALDFHSAGAMDVTSGYRVQASYGQICVQEKFASRYTSQIDCLAVFSTYLVASITPIFADSTLRLEAQVGDRVYVSPMRVNLVRAPNGTPVVLTNSSGTIPNFVMDIIDAGANDGQGAVTLMATDSSQSGATQYGVRIACVAASGTGTTIVAYARLRVTEWR